MNYNELFIGNNFMKLHYAKVDIFTLSGQFGCKDFKFDHKD